MSIYLPETRGVGFRQVEFKVPVKHLGRQEAQGKVQPGNACEEVASTASPKARR